MLGDSRSIDPLQYLYFPRFFVLLALARAHLHAQPNMKDSSARLVSLLLGQYCPPVCVGWHKSWPLPYPGGSVGKGGSVLMASELRDLVCIAGSLLCDSEQVVPSLGAFLSPSIK